jgi:hypothetical protein
MYLKVRRFYTVTSRIASLFILVVAVASMVFISAVASWAQQDQAGTVTYSFGDVSIARAGAPVGQAVPVSTGVREPLFLGDVVRTGSASHAEVTLRDESVITLLEDSEFEVAEALFEPAAGRRSTTVRLFRGMARVVVQPLSGTAAESRFSLETPTAVVGVRGSESVIQAPPLGGDKTTLWVLNSTWQAQNADPSISQLVDVPTEFFTEIFKGQPPTTPKPIPPDVLKWLRQVSTLLKQLAVSRDSGPGVPLHMRRIPPGWPTGLQTVLNQKSKQQAMPTAPHKDLLQFGPPFHQDPSQIPEPLQCEIIFRRLVCF